MIKITKNNWYILKPQSMIRGRRAVISLGRDVAYDVAQAAAEARQECVEAYERFAESEVVATAKNCIEALQLKAQELNEQIEHFEQCKQKHEQAVKAGDLATAANAAGEMTSAKDFMDDTQNELDTLRQFAQESHDAAKRAFLKASEQVNNELHRTGIVNLNSVYAELLEAIVPFLERFAAAQANLGNNFGLMHEPGSRAKIEDLIGDRPVSSREDRGEPKSFAGEATFPAAGM